MTETQLKALKFIHGFISERGYSPSYDEIREHMGLKSKSGVTRIVERLQGYGFIAVSPGRVRSLEVTQKGLYKLGKQSCPTCGRAV